MTETQTLTAKANASVPSELPFQNTDTVAKNPKVLQATSDLPVLHISFIPTHTHTLSNTVRC